MHKWQFWRQTQVPASAASEIAAWVTVVESNWQGERINSVTRIMKSRIRRVLCKFRTVAKQYEGKSLRDIYPGTWLEHERIAMLDIKLSANQSSQNSLLDV